MRARAMLISAVALVAAVVFALAASAAPGPGSLHPNPSFDTSTAGWGAYQGVVTWNAGDALVRRTSGSYVTLNDDAAPAVTSALAQELVAEASVQAPIVGAQYTIKLRERTPGGALVQDVAGGTVTATSVGQEFLVHATLPNPTAGNRVDTRLSIYNTNTTAQHRVHYLDLQYAGAPPPPPPDEAPTVSFTFAPAAPVTDQTVTFTGTATDDGTITSRTWDLDDDGQFDDGSGATASRSFAAAGSYRVGFQATDNTGNTSRAFEQVPVTQAPPQVVVPTAPTGLSVFTDNTADGVAVISWAPNPAGQNVDEYQLYFDGGWQVDATTDGQTTSYVKQDGTPGGTFTVRVSAHNSAGYGPWGPLVTGTYGEVEDPDPPPPPPPPTGEGTFDNPFPQSPGRITVAGRAVDPNSTFLTDRIIGSARQTSSGRGPNLFTSGERRWPSGPESWTFRGSGLTETANAPACISGSGSPDDTYGVYDEVTGKVIRGWGGDSVALNINCSANTLQGATMGVADIDGDGVPYRGNGTAWGRMSFEGVVGGDDWAAGDIDHYIKYALGNNVLADNVYRYPALSQESKATGSAVPMGSVSCHNWTPAQLEGFYSTAALTGDALRFARMLADATACGDVDGDGKAGYGIVAGDGTGGSGTYGTFNLYISGYEVPLDPATTMRRAVRMPAGGNVNNPVGGFWNPAGWETKVEQAGG